MLGGGAAPSVAAGLGNAASIGKLAVPAAWSGALPGVVHPTSAIPVSTISAAPEAAGGAGNLLGGMPLAGMGTGGASRRRTPLRIPPHRHGPPTLRRITTNRNEAEVAATCGRIVAGRQYRRRCPRSVFTATGLQENDRNDAAHTLTEGPKNVAVHGHQGSIDRPAASTEGALHRPAQPRSQL